MRARLTQYRTATDAVRDFHRLGYEETVRLARALPLGSLNAVPMEKRPLVAAAWHPLLEHIMRLAYREAGRPEPDQFITDHTGSPKADDIYDGAVICGPVIPDGEWPGPPAPERDRRDRQIRVAVWARYSGGLHASFRWPEIMSGSVTDIRDAVPPLARRIEAVLAEREHSRGLGVRRPLR